MASSSYKYGMARAALVHLPLLLLLFFAPTARYLHGSAKMFSAAEKGKARQEGNYSPPTKRGRGRPRKHPASPVVASRGRGGGSLRGDERLVIDGRHAMAARPSRPRFRSAEVQPEFVVWSADPTSTWL